MNCVYVVGFFFLRMVLSCIVLNLSNEQNVWSHNQSEKCNRICNFSLVLPWQHMQRVLNNAFLSVQNFNCVSFEIIAHLVSNRPWYDCSKGCCINIPNDRCSCSTIHVRQLARTTHYNWDHHAYFSCIQLHVVHAGSVHGGSRPWHVCSGYMW